MNVSRNEFTQQNTVLRVCKIIRVNHGNGVKDIIDLNGNGKADSLGHADDDKKYTEPALSESYKTLLAFAARRGAAVVTSQDLEGELGAQNVEFTQTYEDYSAHIPANWKTENNNSLDEVAAKREPLENVSWAIDPIERDFLIFVPGKVQQCSAPAKPVGHLQGSSFQ